MRTGPPTRLCGALAVALAVPTTSALAQTPPAPSPGQPPTIHRVEIANGAFRDVRFVLPPDAPPELRTAYKALEMAERDVTIAEELQNLKLQYVLNERTLETLRTGQVLQAALWQGPVGSNAIYGTPAAAAAMAEPSLKREMASVLASEANARTALESLARLEVMRKRSADLFREYVKAQGADTRGHVLKELIGAEHERREEHRKVAVLVEGAAEKREAEARRQEGAALDKLRNVIGRYRDAEADQRPAIWTEWDTADWQWRNAHRKWEETHAALSAVRKQVADLSERQPAQVSGPPTSSAGPQRASAISVSRSAPR
jgi:hypothetical protein